MDIRYNSRGSVSGYEVWSDDKEWHWRAYGPKGIRSGTGTSEENCYSQVWAAEQELK